MFVGASICMNRMMAPNCVQQHMAVAMKVFQMSVASLGFRGASHNSLIATAATRFFVALLLPLRFPAD